MASKFGQNWRWWLAKASGRRYWPRWTLSLAAGLLGLVVMGAADPRNETSVEDLIRQANAAFASGDREAADRLYAAAEERTADPGLVAFNRGAVLYQLGEYRDGELRYVCVLSDAACPPERAGKAWYNRGTCLLRRGGSPAIYREAIGCFQRCLGSAAADEPLKADARYNLELAKILWNEARKAANLTDSPNDDPPANENQSQPPKSGPNDTQAQAADSGNDNPAGRQQRPVGIENRQPPVGTEGNNPANHTVGSASHLQPLQDTSSAQPLSPEDTREHLRRTQERLKKDRQVLKNSLYGPERPGLMDW